MKKSIKAALLFSTLVFGTVEVSAISQPQYGTQVVAHADSTGNNDSSDYSSINSIKDNVVKKILLNSVNNNGGNYTDPSQITNEDLNNLSNIYFIDNSSTDSITTLEGLNKSILPNINSVYIQNVDMSKIGDLQPLTQWNNIQSITLSGDNINSNQLSSLNNWQDSQLSSIDLSNNKVTSLDFLKNISIPNVTSINVSNNEISDFSPVKNQNWTQLQKLIADNNNITDISPISEVNWPNLEVLSVSNNHISSLDSITKANWPNLSQLFANNNNISNIDAFANTNWHKLTTISAAYNHISNVASLKGKKDQFPNLTTFIVNNNNINDISWMNGFKFSINSNAKQQVINTSVDIVKPDNGKDVFIPLPVSLKDVNLDNNLLASSDDNGSNFQANNSYLDSYNQNGILIPSSDVIGNDNKPNTSSDGNKSNGISGLNIASGSGSQKYTFGFTSTLGINQPNYFYGAYNITVNWGQKITKDKNVTVTVKYVGDDGKTLGTQTKSVKFTETGFQPDDSTKQTTWNNDWQTSDNTHYNFTSDNYDGYQDPSQNSVSGNLTPDSDDLTETVTYKSLPASNSGDNDSNADNQSNASIHQSIESQSSAVSSSAQSVVNESSSTSSSVKSAVNESSATSSSVKSAVNESSATSSSVKSAVNESSATSSSVKSAVNESSATSSSDNTQTSSHSITDEHSNNASNPSKSFTVESASNTTSSSSTNEAMPQNEHNNNNAKPVRNIVSKKQNKNALNKQTQTFNKTKLPQTGDKTRQNALISIGAVAIVTALGLATFALRRKNK
ncbi:leucine-rich repeat domain-containing protein [Apilactobacillus kunkeei]|uniref:leucine-rich repeat domain-containing protein n=1 Tax=Apilactobacillus kunkeei TaxID=148814 RepID=UPI001C6FC350|nr:leucine-rich repeat domain-containing protein [Apilactobacillus kunkeei]MBX8456173.1 leucine-rich repeat domain-containing protein [Apilactobacillus kunkeei]QYU54332.1 leucine-rich repeat domain-containing protein [Apilactobacillus kunkeei]